MVSGEGMAQTITQAKIEAAETVIMTVREAEGPTESRRTVQAADLWLEDTR